MKNCRGFSMVELMVALVIGIVTVLIAGNVLTTYEGQKRSTTGGNDAQLNGAIALYELERQVRGAGFGLASGAGLLCSTINLYYGSAVVANGANDAASLGPVYIIDGGTRPDTIRFLSGNSNFGTTPATIVANMASAAALIEVSTWDTKDSTQWSGTLQPGGMVQGGLILVGASDGSKVCTVMQLSATPTADSGNPEDFDLTHASGASYPYNPSAYSVFTSSLSYGIGDFVINMGTQWFRKYAVLCNDGNAPSATNSCDLVDYDPLAVTSPSLSGTTATTTVERVASQIVDLHAQYGIATPVSGSCSGQPVSSWVDATGSWADPTGVNINCIRAIKIAVVARSSKPEKTAVSPSTLTVLDKTRTLSTAQQYYRYKVLTTIVPVMNVIWGAT